MGQSLYSLAKFSANVMRANIGALPNPYKLMFVVTKRCYSQCVYCEIWKVKEDPTAMARELSLDEIVAVARANPYFQWIDFTGGEPTDRPDFVEVVRAFSDHCPHLLLVHFPTNGIATKKIVATVQSLRSFLKAKLVVSVSVDGPPEINDRLRGIRHDFQHAMETFSALQLLLGENVHVGMTLHGHSGTCGLTCTQLVEATFAAINQHRSAQGNPALSWATFHVNIPHFSSHYYNNAGAAPPVIAPRQQEELKEAVRFLIEKNGRAANPMRILERIYRLQALRYLDHGRTPLRCEALNSTVYLSEQGVVYPCSIWNRPLGSLRETNYRLGPLLEQAKAAGLRQAVVAGQCPHCWTPCEAYHAIGANLGKSLAGYVLGP